MISETSKGLNPSKRIAFFYTQGCFDTVPCLVSTVKLLARQGYEIDIFMSMDKDYIMPDYPDQNINFIQLNGYYGKDPFKLSWTLLDWAVFFLSRSRKKRYRYLVGVHLPGLVLATFLGAISNTPVIYYNLEIYFSKELKRVSWKLLKAFEAWCSRRSVFTITQDKWRARLLSEENNIPAWDIVCLPNSPIGNACSKKSFFLHEKFGIDKSKKIILTMSSRFFRSKFHNDIMKITSGWPEEWILVSHAKCKNLNSKSVSNNNKRVIFSTEPIQHEMFEQLVSSADLGLVLYQNENIPCGGLNETYMGYSSGQFNYYLKFGIPAITTDQPTFKEIFSDYKCGVAISSPGHINQAIRDIFSNYNDYRSESVRCYNDLLCFENYFPELLKRL